MGWEFTILDWIQNNMRSPWLDTLVANFSELANIGAPWILLALVLIMYKPTRRTGCFLAAAMLLEFVVVDMGMKPLFDRPRPCDVNTAIDMLVQRPNSASFPSGHSAQAFVVSSALYYCHSKLFVPVLVVSVLMALSRLYLYVHFPTDVMIGMLVGWLCGFVAVEFCRKWELKNGPRL